MASTQNRWRTREVLAFTQHDGPGRPPAGPSAWSVGALTGVLGVTFAGVLATDVLCPEHRVWVQALGGVAVFASGAGLVGLVRGWAGAVHLTLLASLAGVSIGGIDAMHSPTRGWLLTFGFGLASVLAAVMAWRAQRLAAWDRLLVATAPAAVDEARPAIETVDEADEADEVAAADEVEAGPSTGTIPTAR